ncbi:MAG: flagellar biosynthesis protein FlhB [Lachnospiraceae bacterium]|nr:flagellar biosynthesis protein FlhB [Lachnospiraceae bacterium]MDD6449773.1 flagellar biosynthesis protein FlhB [Lachnospiraceae bacterium]
MPNRDGKTEQPTQKRLDDAKKEGNIAKSRDIGTVAILLAGAFLLKIQRSNIDQNLRVFLNYILQMIGNNTPLSGQVAKEFIKAAAAATLPLLLILSAVSVAADGVQTRFAVTPKLMQPKFERINPAKGFQRLFSLRNLFEMLKNLLKITILIFLVYSTIKGDILPAVRLQHVTPDSALIALFDMIFNLVVKVSLAFGVIAVVDFAFQKWQHKRDLMMTKQEVKDELKQEEGNPETKSRIKRKQREISQRRMMQKVPEADVIIRNPTHVAVALKYDPDRYEAPVVLAKGLDSMALRIVKVGEENGVPWIENKTLARALYSACDLDQEIPPEYFGAVAEILVLIYRKEGREDILK